MTTRLSHVDESGRARMVDVSAKDVTTRAAVARGRVRMQPTTLEQIAAGSIPKGDVLAVARLAGIMGAKRTSELIPLCHPLPLDAIDVDLTPDPEGGCVRILAHARVHARTGVEMEALTAVAIAALTLYDMCKAVDRTMTIDDVCLVEKQGGKSGRWVRPD